MIENPSAIFILLRTFDSNVRDKNAGFSDDNMKKR